MTDYLGSLAARSLNLARGVRPRVAMRFERMTGRGSLSPGGSPAGPGTAPPGFPTPSPSLQRALHGLSREGPAPPPGEHYRRRYPGNPDFTFRPAHTGVVPAAAGQGTGTLTGSGGIPVVSTREPRILETGGSPSGRFRISGTGPDGRSEGGTAGPARPGIPAFHAAREIRRGSPPDPTGPARDAPQSPRGPRIPVPPVNAGPGTSPSLASKPTPKNADRIVIPSPERVQTATTSTGRFRGNIRPPGDLIRAGSLETGPELVPAGRLSGIRRLSPSLPEGIGRKDTPWREQYPVPSAGNGTPVQVTIGRIEVHAREPDRPAVHRSPPRILDLEDYLGRRRKDGGK